MAWLLTMPSRLKLLQQVPDPDLQHVSDETLSEERILQSVFVLGRETACAYLSGAPVLHLC